MFIHIMIEAGCRMAARLSFKAVAYRFFTSSVASAVTAAAVVSAEEVAQCAVFPHRVYEGGENGSAAARKHAFQTIFGTT